MNKKLIIILVIAIAAILILISQVTLASVVLQQPVNYSVLSSKTVWFNFSGNANCTENNYTYRLIIGYSNGTVLSNKTMLNDTPTHFYNQTTLEIDSGFGQYHNWTIYENVTTLAGFGYFKVDSTAPTFPATPSFTLGNKSTGGNYINVTANITDQNPGGCYLTLYWGDGTNTNASSEISYDTSSNNSVCMANVTPSSITQDGYAEVAMGAKDQAGNSGIETNQSYIMYRLKAGWNLITGYENKTLAQIAAEVTNITYVSVWDNMLKVFWTHTAGGSTNSTLPSNFSSPYSAGSAFVYANADVAIMRRHYAVPLAWQNVTLYSNTTAGLTTWNIVGVLKQITDLNATITRNNCTNTTGQPSYGPNCANITWVSFWSTQEQKFCSFYRGRMATSCSLTSNQYNLTRGDALWIAVQTGANITLMRGSW
jgi:hypothetical protein